jgi:hypothetical protein
MTFMRKPFNKGTLMMFEKSWAGYPGSSLAECLIVFAAIFLAGSLWAFCVRCYIHYRLKETVDA